MKFPHLGLILLLFVPFLGACDDMHHQPSIKAQEEPRLSSPAEAVPVSGKERVAFGAPQKNPLADEQTSRQKGAELFLINCALCHGTAAIHPGKVGAKLSPPPPQLRDGHLVAYDEATLFQLISLGFGRMPAFRYRLRPEERWQLVNYLRSNE